jgi:ribosomal protein S6E (S10)
MTDKIVTVVIVRHPDMGTQYSAYAPAGVIVQFIEADLGSSFDGEPTDEEEAEVALEIAKSLEEGTADLPDSETKSLALSWAETLRINASEYVE